MYDLSIFYWGVYVLVYYTVITKNFTWFTEMLQKWIFYLYGLQFSSVQSLSHVRLFATPWSCTPCATHQASLSITNSWSLLKLMFIESVMPSNHLILCCPLLLPPSIFPTIRGTHFPMSQFFTLGGQSIGVSAAASVLSMNIQDWFPLGWTGWIF